MVIVICSPENVSSGVKMKALQNDGSAGKVALKIAVLCLNPRSLPISYYNHLTYGIDLTKSWRKNGTVGFYGF